MINLIPATIQAKNKNIIKPKPAQPATSSSLIIQPKTVIIKHVNAKNINIDIKIVIVE
mgnify:CR=1 FL=1